ncbi:MAG: hypothetical protein KDA66_12100 [Planctomycetaceae bacterium]|nr:hypothetical protein [Planctomycetaceae bacterium]
MPDSEESRQLGLNVLIRVPSVTNGMGAMLWCRGNLPECLEIFTYGDDSWDGTYDGLDFEESSDC